MTYLVINRGTDGFREALVIQRGGDRILFVDDIVMAQSIEFIRCNTGFYVRPYHLQDLAGQTAGNAHFFDFFWRFDVY